MTLLGLEMRPAVPEPPHRRASAAAVLVSLAVVLAVLAAGVAVVTRTFGGTADYEGVGTGSVLVTVESGDTVARIAQRLKDAGVVKSASAFVDAAADDPRADRIGPGIYRLRGQMSSAAALQLMVDPKTRQASRLTLREGLRATQTLALVSKATRIPVATLKAALARTGELGLPAWATGGAEGLLFPATYDLSPPLSAEGLLRRMVTRFKQAAEDADLVAGAEDMDMSAYEVLVVASLVQAEGIPADYGKVARVIYNRLEEGMRLELDSTVNYALGTSKIQLSAAELAVDSPYNTYRVKGLPVGPICSPGMAALEAALDPPKGDWLYFVTVDPKKKTTVFTDSYEEFLALKRQLRGNL